MIRTAVPKLNCIPFSVIAVSLAIVVRVSACCVVTVRCEDDGLQRRSVRIKRSIDNQIIASERAKFDYLPNSNRECAADGNGHVTCQSIDDIRIIPKPVPYKCSRIENQRIDSIVRYRNPRNSRIRC